MTAANVIKPMTICLEDENLRDFIQEIQDSACLREIFAASKYWKQGGEEAVNLLCNYNFKTIPEEVASIIEKLLTDVCPDSCEACGCPIEWNQMSATLLNGDNLCDYHHQRKEKMEKE